MNLVKTEEKRKTEKPKISTESLQKKIIKNLRQTKEKIDKNHIKIL